jgi:hypothetical protein
VDAKGVSASDRGVLLSWQIANSNWQLAKTKTFFTADLR